MIKVFSGNANKKRGFSLTEKTLYDILSSSGLNGLNDLCI